MGPTRALATFLAVAAVTAGCTEGAVDKGGGSGGVLTLAMAVPDSPGSPAGAHVEHFADRVQSLSGGRLRIEVTWDVAHDERSFDQQTAQRVIEGDAELGLVPARAWDVLGVTTLQALQAPFLVTSDAALDAVVSDPVAEDMLAGLEELGVTGLGLLPEGLRHPAGYSGPLREPADFAGVGIRAPRSELSYEVLQALGAEPMDVSGEAESVAFGKGDLAGAETSAAYLPTLPRPAVMTANVTPYAKANVLVANSAALAGLTDDHRDALRQAAAATLAHALDTRNSDAEDLAIACEQGLGVVFASDEQRAAMTDATRPVRDRLAADPTTGPFLARITQIVAGAGTPSPVSSCEAATAGAATALTGWDGVWRFEVTYQDGLDAGLPEEVAAGDMGVQTVRLDGGRYRWTWRSRSNGTQTCEGGYSEEDGLLVFRDDGGPYCSGHWAARPALVGDEIRWTDARTRVEGDVIDRTVRRLLHSVPWRKVEDLPQVAALPEGVYRWDVDEDELVAAGVDTGTAHHNSGLMTMTIEDGRWLHHTQSAAHPPDCGGTYETRGPRVVFSSDDCGGEVFSGRFSATEDGIRFTDLRPAGAFSDIHWGTPWRRIR